MGMRILAGLLFISFIGVVSLAEGISDFLRERSMFGFGMAKYRNESTTKVRVLGFLGMLVSGVLITQSSQLIIGMIMIALGLLILQYSFTVYNFIASAGMGNSPWFKGDDGVKLAGLLMVLGGALWMSGVTQAILFGIFRTGGLVR